MGQARWIVLAVLAASVVAGVPSPSAPSAAVVSGGGTVADCDVDLAMAWPTGPTPVSPPVACGGIRPGAKLQVPIPGQSAYGWCTQSFVFRGTSFDEDGEPVDEGLFVATAGHCLSLEEVHPPTAYVEGEASVFYDADGERIGEAAFSVLQFGNDPDDDRYLDFGLIRIDESRWEDVDPAQCHFGGPTAMGDVPPMTSQLQLYGHGLTYEQTLPGRTLVTASGVVEVGDDEYSVMQVGGEQTSVMVEGPVDQGDSGAAITATAGGSAVGLVSGTTPLGVIVPLVSRHLPIAEATTGITFDLVTAGVP